MPGIDMSALATGSAFGQLGDGDIGQLDLGVELLELCDQRQQRCGHCRRNGRIALAQEAGERAAMNWALRSDNPDLGKMPAQAVEDLSALADQHLAHLVVH